MAKSKDSEILKLLEFVKKHQTYKGDVLKKPLRTDKSISEWMEDQGIESGPHSCRGPALYNTYKTWCASKSITPAYPRNFHFALRQVLEFKDSEPKNNLHYYINKKVKYGPKKTSEEKGQAASKEASKEDQEG